MLPDNNSLYRLLPAVHELLGREELQELRSSYGQPALLEAVRTVLRSWREQLRTGQLTEATLPAAVQGVAQSVAAALAENRRPHLRRVLNATGVALQTNLGRAPLSADAIARIGEIASGYCDLEFDLATGERSRRGAPVEDLLLQVLQQYPGVPPHGYAAAIVNNCAAATFLALNTLAGGGGEVVVSRGELVEIGGGFRIPEILAKSGAVLREVGTTNKTRRRDYEQAMHEGTRLLLRVHRANFSMVGFTEQPTLDELVSLGRERNVPVFDDQGTGCLLDTTTLGLPAETTLASSLAAGCTVVAASGDKLLGGPQCGLLVGERAAIDAMRSNPLFRALRVDKLTLAALDATLQAYAAGQAHTLPVFAMLLATEQSLHARCERLAEALRAGHADGLEIDVVPVRSVVGGGTTPGASLPGYALSLRPRQGSEGALARQLRSLPTPVVGRLSEGRVLLDLRTIAPPEDALLLSLLQGLREQG